MASAAFRSTSRRSSAAADAASSTRTPTAGGGRRYRSLSRGPGRFPPATPEPDERPTPRSRFVNKSRGSGFPEVSLDDLADEFFWARGEEGSDVSPRVGMESSRVRGRSVSKYSERKQAEIGGGGDAGGRRRRSVSAVRCRGGDCQNGMDTSRSSGPKDKSQSSCNGNFQQAALHKPNTPARLLRRSMSQKDLSQAHDSYSSYSSSVTDDEAWEVHTNKNGNEKTIRAVHSLEKMEHPEDGEGTGFYEAMRKEVRNAVGEIRIELEKAMVKPGPASIVNDDGVQPKSSNVIEVIADIRHCTSILEQSENRKQELLAELAVEEQRGQELTMMVRELLPEPKQSTTTKRPARSRRRSNDRTLMSKRLDEEAERYFEDFLSNVEDTDVSSFDGERSDAGSAIGGNARRNSGVCNTVSDTHVDVIKAASMPAMMDLIKAASVPTETDGVTFPWLQWETSADISPSPCKNKLRVPMELGSNLFTATQVASPTGIQCNDRRVSFGSWGLEGSGSSTSVLKDVAVCRREVAKDQSSTSDGERRNSYFDMDEYSLLQQNEDLLFESLRQRNRTESGGLVLCRRGLI